MAKKRRKEEDKEFEFPEFNEEEFLRKEITGTKVMILTIILAIAAAIVSYFLTLAGVVIVAFFAGLAFVFLLKYFVRIFNIDIGKFERKDWLSHGFTFFFAWLAIWVLLLNVPFSDVTQPNLSVFVEGNEVPGHDSTVFVNNTASTVTVTVKATDNAGIKGVYIQDPDGTDSIEMSWQPGDNLWTHQVDLPSTTKRVTVITEDVSGNPPVSITFTIAKQG